MKALLLPFAIALMISVCSLAAAQESKRRSTGDISGAGKMDLIQVLRNHTVRMQLDLTDKQEFELEKLRDRLDEERNEIFDKARTDDQLTEDQRRDLIEEGQKEVMVKTEAILKEIEDVLRPEQLKRVSQVIVQLRFRDEVQRNLTALLNDDIAEYLEISTSQKDRIHKKAKQVYEELEKKIAVLRLEAEAEIQSELSDDQKEKLEELIGKPIKQ